MWSRDQRNDWRPDVSQLPGPKVGISKVSQVLRSRVQPGFLNRLAERFFHCFFQPFVCFGRLQVLQFYESTGAKCLSSAFYARHHAHVSMLGLYNKER